jgi:tRNA/rRNA methyltransferase
MEDRSQNMEKLKKIRVVLIEPEIEGNIGFLARAMKNFGLKELYLVRPKTKIRDTARAFAAHAYDVLQNIVYTENVDEALQGVNTAVGTTSVKAKRNLNIRRNTIDVKKFTSNLITDYSVGLLFGRESSGLTNKEADLCDFLLTIPTSPEYPTMNISHAATIVFYEVFTTLTQDDGSLNPGAKRREKEILIDYFIETATKAGLKKHKIALAKRSFRNVIGRSFLTSREATTLMGAYRKILGAFKRGAKHDGKD